MPQLDTKINDLNEIVPDHRKRVLPWQRSQIPNLAEAKNLEEQVEALGQLKGLIERGRLWYALMTPLRALLSVWSSWSGRALILVMLFMGYMLNAYMYVQVLQYRSDTVSVDSSFGDNGWTLLLWPWNRESQVLDAVARHDAQVELHYMAKTMGWTIPRFLARVEYAEGSRPVDKCLEYDEWSKIRQWKRELGISLRLKPKVDELMERGSGVNWIFNIEPPYLNEDELDTLLKQVEVAERMKPIADELVQRATQIDWDLTTELKRNPYDEQQVIFLQAKLAESETLHPTVIELRSSLEELSWHQTISPPYNSEQVSKLVQEVDDTIRLKEAMTELFGRAEKIGWLLTDSPFKQYPYTDEHRASLLRQLEEAERTHASVQKVVREAAVFGWQLQNTYAQPPYDETLLREHQTALKEMNRLKSQFQRLSKQYKSIGMILNLRIPFTELDLLDARERYDMYRESNPVGEELIRQLRNVDVDGNLYSPYSPDEVEGLRDCLQASQIFTEYGKRGYDCACQYQWGDEFLDIECGRYDWNHPKVEETIEALRRENVKVATRSKYSSQMLNGLQQCWEHAQTKDNLANNCECQFQGDDFKELKCEYRVSSECSSIQNSDFKHLCRRECSSIRNDDLELLCKDQCSWIANDDIKQLCKGQCSWIKDDDWKNMCNRSCNWIQDPDLKRACKGKWYLR